ncbi:cold-shock' DNA-binding domain-containing protein [Thamnocephalis sphaerospora]|uniref:Cold-shock' DNA-binding domain-containing protein n=1 Tax=Thamnocephalis sphaerospora TaxID=78915 RepID=A0A4V1IVS7_9FUNG|nr:cold-shock' DNA-binding domain-containing protein [Thamnocephalis sphaerospora]|eukprot:RKP05099.1 cold-shock' DNA-binding domain-containing protein [Thamnocephalis sphaerospora]
MFGCGVASLPNYSAAAPCRPGHLAGASPTSNSALSSSTSLTGASTLSYPHSHMFSSASSTTSNGQSFDSYSTSTPNAAASMSMTPTGMTPTSIAGAGSTRKTGRVKFFNSQKGFGFVIPDDKATFGNAEVFVHHTAIHNDGGFKSLAEGEDVEFDMVKGPKGFQAANVTGPNGVSVKGDPNAGRSHTGGHGGGNAHAGQMAASSPQLGFGAFGGLPMAGYGIPGQAAFGIPFGQSPPFGNAAMFPGAFGQSQFPIFSGLPTGNFQMQPAAAFGANGTGAFNAAAAAANLQNPAGFMMQNGQSVPQTTLAQDPLTGLSQAEFDLAPHFQGAADQHHYRRTTQQ